MADLASPVPAVDATSTALGPESSHAGAASAPAEETLGVARKHPTIQAGDLVILFVSHTATPLPLTVTPGQEFVNVFGAFPHNDMIGLPFGSRIFSRNKKGFIHLLRPTASLWTLALPHRTQILYYPDISFVSSHLGLTPGARVIEAGTGSGSMTHALVRAVSTEAQRSARWLGVPGMGSTQGRGAGRNARPPRPQDPQDTGDADELGNPDDDDTAPVASDRPLTLDEAGGPLVPDYGRVWSFEFHSERARKAKIEFEAHGLVPNVVALNHRNVCRSGFGLPEGMHADAIFLDLPAPWEAVPFAKAALNPDVATRICTFSPCMEQVLRTTQALSETGFSEIETFESLTREHQPFTASLGPLKDVTHVAARLREIERIKEIKRLEQIERSRLRKEKASGRTAADVPSTEPTEPVSMDTDTDQLSDGKRQAAEPADATDAPAAKRPKLEDASKGAATPLGGLSGARSPQPEYLIASGPKVSSGTTPLEAANVLSKPAAEMRGHTSYLTFATLRPQHVVAKPQATEATKATQAPVAANQAQAATPVPDGEKASPANEDEGTQST